MSMRPYEDNYSNTCIPISVIPTLTDSEIIAKIDSGYHWTPATITYSFPQSTPFSGYWNNEAAGFSPLQTSQQTIVTAWMQLWNDLIAKNISSVGTSSTANILLSNTTTGPGYAWSYYPDNIYNASVWYNPNYDSSDGTNNLINPVYGDWGYTAIGHEIGHSLGLRHPGNYDAGSGGTITYAVNAEYIQDTQQYTIMSYFTATNTGSDISASNGYTYYPQTPMMDDIMVIQAMYGGDTTTRTTDTVYGFNSTANNNVFNFSANTHPWICIYDADGTDTLDLSGWNTASYISLVPGTFSNADGMTNNISIARNTIIENATGGGGNDTLIGNTYSNILNGGAGADTMTGGDGSDYYYVDNSGDVVTETNAAASTGGYDRVYSNLTSYTLPTNIEEGSINIIGSANLTGNSLDNTLYAGNDDNIIDGSGGTDSVSYYYGATSGVTANLLITTAQATGGSGSDTLLNIENLTGSNYNDTLTGDANNNILNGGVGADMMTGGDGSDYYYVDNSGDAVTETNATASTGGFDRVYSSLSSYTLPANVEYGDIIASGSAHLTGNSLDNILFAAIGDNTIDGSGGTDTVSYYYGSTSGVTANLSITTVQATGGSGSDTLLNIENLTGSNYNDTLTGDANNNTLNGGTGADTMTGGTGNDTFMFAANSNGIDTITDFVYGDTITISGATFSTSVTSGNGATVGLNQIQLNASGDQTTLYIGTDNVVGADVTILLNGVFSTSSLVASGSSIQVANLNKVKSDFNGDGKSDILWRNSGTGANVIWNSGNSATSTSITAIPDQNWKMAGIGDFGSDGRSDIIWRNSTTGATLIWHSGNSATSGPVTTVGQTWKIVGVGDFTGDGKADILWRDTGSGANALWNSGDSSTGSALTAISDQNWVAAGTGDFGGDSKTDILWRNSTTGATVIWNSGNSATSGAVTTVGLNWIMSGTGDFNGDVKDDVLWHDTGGSGANILWNSGNPATVSVLTALSDQNWKVSGTGDYNGDGKSDILWRNISTGDNTIWLSGNSATTQSTSNITTANSIINPSTSELIESPSTGHTVRYDFSGDGKADILWRNTVNGVTVIWNSGDSAAGSVLPTVSDPNWKIGSVGDYNGDGKADIFWRNSSTGGTVIWHSGNSATSSAVTTIGLSWKIVGVGDFNGDGKDDVLWRDTVTGANAIWNPDNPGNGSFTAVTDQNWKIAGVGDFGGDGKADIFWRNSSTGGTVIWHSGNSATSSAVTTLGLSWELVGVGDFNGDGKDDALWRDTATGVNAIWNPSNPANGSLTAIPDQNWKVAGTGDYNGDGRADILWRNISSGIDVIWRSGDSSTAVILSTVGTDYAIPNQTNAGWVL